MNRFVDPAVGPFSATDSIVRTLVVPTATTRRECNLEFQLVSHWHAPGSLTRCRLQTDIAEADYLARPAQMTVFAQPLDSGSPDHEPLGLQRAQMKRQHRHQSLADHMFE